MAFLIFDEPEQGRTEGLRLRISRMSPSMRRRPRRALREAGDDSEVTRTIGPVLAARTRAGASIRRTGGLPDAEEKIRIHRSDRPDGKRACSSPGEIKGRARLPRRPWGLGWRRFRA